MKKTVEKMCRLSSMKHCNVITFLSDFISLEVSLQLRFCTFSSSFHKYASKVVKTVTMVELRNPLSVYCDNVQAITDQCLQVN